MSEYHKINSLYKRNKITNHLIPGDWSIPEFEYLAESRWEFTEKVDGTNIRVMYTPYNAPLLPPISFGGRTDSAQLPAQLLTRLEARFMTEKALEKFAANFNEPVVFYGEGYGAKIQKVGSKYLSYQDFVLFDVKVGKWWLKRRDVEVIADTFGLSIVPIYGYGTLYDAEKLVVNGIKSFWGDFEAEGIIAKTNIGLLNRAGHRIIAKIKGVDYGVDLEFSNQVKNRNLSDDYTIVEGVLNRTNKFDYSQDPTMI